MGCVDTQSQTYLDKQTHSHTQPHTATHSHTQTDRHRQTHTDTQTNKQSQTLSHTQAPEHAGQLNDHIGDGPLDRKVPVYSVSGGHHHTVKLAVFEEEFGGLELLGTRGVVLVLVHLEHGVQNHPWPSKAYPRLSRKTHIALHRIRR